jgi:hypothetical protein
MIDHLNHLGREYEAESVEYTKVITDQKAFFIQNMIRAKRDNKPNVDELIIVTDDNDVINFDKEILFHPDPKISSQH